MTYGGSPYGAAPYGGVESDEPEYVTEVFTTDDTWDWAAAGSPDTVDVWLVAGGGSGGKTNSGGWGPGGGGAGGVRLIEGLAVDGNRAIVVGAGGAAVTTNAFGNDGGNSSFGVEAVTGGGGGSSGANNTAGRSGGSGGGGSSTGAGGVGVTGQGNDGGVGQHSQPYIGGGGGGKGGVGVSGTNGGAGGSGVAGPTWAPEGTYGIGGAGGAWTGTSGAVGASGANGFGGGGAGIHYQGASSGAGGSGVVAVRYAVSVQTADALSTESGGDLLTESSDALLVDVPATTVRTEDSDPVQTESGEFVTTEGAGTELTVSDSGVGVDSASVEKSVILQTSDVGSGLEDSIASADVVVSDASSGVNSSSSEQSHVVSDSVSSTDAANLVAGQMIAVSDSSSAVDSSDNSVSASSTDAFLGVDSSSTSKTVTVVDSGSFLDTSSLSATQTKVVSDDFSGSDVSSVSLAVTSSDSASTSESSALSVSISKQVSDLGSAIDSGSVTITYLIDSDTADIEIATSDVYSNYVEPTPKSTPPGDFITKVDLVVRVVQRDGTRLAELTRARVTNMNWSLNEIGQATVAIPTTDSKASLIQPLKTEIQILHEDRVVWWGVPWIITGNAHELEIKCDDVLSYMNKWFITKSTYEFTDYDQFKIMFEILQDYRYDYHLESGNTGTVHMEFSGVLRSRRYWREEHQNMLDILKEFTTLKHGFDFSCEIRHTAGEPQRWMVFHYPRKGVYRPDMLLEWGKNIMDFTYNEDALGIANEVYATGGQASNVKFEENYLDEAAVAEYEGRLTKIISEGTVLDVDWLKARAVQEVKESRDPIIIPEVTVRNEPLQVFKVLDVGDIVPIKIDCGRVQVAENYRVASITWQPADVLNITFNEDFS